MEVVNNIISNCRDKYKDRFKYYLTGSYARNEKNFKDYDIAIYDLENNNKDWELLLKQFFNVKELDGKDIFTLMKILKIGNTLNIKIFMEIYGKKK